MATILRARGLRIVIYSNDHWPPHCHVVGHGCEAKVALGDAPARPWLVTNNGFSQQQISAALKVVVEHRVLLRQRWRELHGDR